MSKLILFCCFCHTLSAFLYLPSLPSDTCTPMPYQEIPNLVLPANLMCQNSGSDCYEPPEARDVGIKVLNGPLKAAKAYFKYTGENKSAGWMGGFNALADFTLLWLKDEASLKESAVFTIRIAREILRAQQGSMRQRLGSPTDIITFFHADSFPTSAKAVLKIPLLIEKNLDWGDNTTDTSLWLLSSMPGITLALAEHYARFNRHTTLRSLVGFGITMLEVASFSSLCEEGVYKSARQLIRMTLHGLQYRALWQDRNLATPYRFRTFTLLNMAEHLFISLADALYYKFYQVLKA